MVPELSSKTLGLSLLHDLGMSSPLSNTANKNSGYRGASNYKVEQESNSVRGCPFQRHSDQRLKLLTQCMTIGNLQEADRAPLQ